MRSAIALILLGTCSVLTAQEQDHQKPVSAELKQLIKQLHNANHKTHRIAEAKIKKMGVDAIRAVPDLMVAAEQHHHKTGKMHAAYEIRMAVIKQGGPLEVLKEFTNHSDQDVRTWSYLVLESIGPKAKSLVPHLIANLKSAESTKHVGAVRVLGFIGPTAKEAIPTLIDSMRQPEHWRTAVDSLVKMGPIGIPSLLEALRNMDPAIRRGAAECLGNLGAPAERAKASLVALLEDNEPFVQVTAATSYWKLGGAAKEILPVLRTAVSQNSEVSDLALQTLASLKDGAIPATPELVRLIDEITSQAKLSDRQIDRAQRATNIIANFGPRANSALDILYRMLSHSERALRTPAALAIYRIEKNSDRTVPVLIELTSWREAGTEQGSISSRNRRIQIRAIQALGKMGKDADASIPGLIELVLHGNSTRSHYAAKSLGEMGKSSLTALQQAMKRTGEIEIESRRKVVRKRIQRSLEQIKKQATKD